MKKVILMLIVTFAGFGFSNAVFAYDFGTGTGCSSIGGVDATGIMDGDTFVGRIGTTGVSGFNKNGKPVDNSDGDAFTNSLEECINDALVGFCTTVGGSDSNIIVEALGTFGRNDNQQQFRVTFAGTGCGISQCSDQVDNDGDSDGIDFPADPDCTDYDDNDESA